MIGRSIDLVDRRAVRMLRHPGVRASLEGFVPRSAGRIRRTSRFRARQGQALVIGVTIMFILLAVGMLFLRSALNHLASSSVSNQNTAINQYSLAGIDYVDHQLMTSALGADWRPTAANLTPGVNGVPVLAVLDPDFQYLRPWAPVNAAPVTITDPATGQPLVYEGQTVLLSPAGPSGGYTRVNFGQGRALVRVVYNPRNALWFNTNPELATNTIGVPLATDLPGTVNPGNPNDPLLVTRGPWTEYGPTPLSRYLRIDSIGRYGSTAAVDASGYTDPTVLVDAGINLPYAMGTTAYKAFGFGDHLLFVTNREKEGGTFNVGCSSGIAGVAGFTPGLTLLDGAFGQVQGDLGSQEFVGDVVVNGAASFNGAVVNQTFPGGSPLAGVDAPLLPGSGVSSAGPMTGGLWIDYNGATTPINAPAAFSLFTGDLVRDNAWFTNETLSPNRSVTWLQLPTLDLSRYRSLTAGSGNGAGVHIANFSDMQPGLSLPQVFTSEVHSAQDLDIAPRSWANPFNPPAEDQSSWTSPGSHYSPPGVLMVFHRPGQLSPTVPTDPTDPDGQPGGPHFKYYYIRLYSESMTWPWADGVASTSHYLDVYYTPDAVNDPTLQAASQATSANPRILQDLATGDSYQAPVALVTNHTIMAEGNLIVHGDLAPGMMTNGTGNSSDWWGFSNGNTYPERENCQLMVVSRGTIYVDGSINRAEQGTGSLQDIVNYYGANAQLLSPSAVAFLAQDHVAVNLTAANLHVQSWDFRYGGQAVPARLEQQNDLPQEEADVALAPGSQPPSPLHWRFDYNGVGANSRFFRITFSLTGVAQNTPMRIYMRHASKTVDSAVSPNTEVDAYLNPPNTLGWPTTGPIRNDVAWQPYRILKSDPTNILPAEQKSITPLVQNSGQDNTWEYSSYLLNPAFLNYGGDNYIDIEVTGDSYFLSRVAIQPTSVSAIPALRLNGAFLANEGGFYVIPSDWFYFNPSAPGVEQRRPDGPMVTGMPIDYANWNGAFPIPWGTDSTYPDTPVSPTGGAALLRAVMLDGSLTVNTTASPSNQQYWSTYDPVQMTFGLLSANRWPFNVAGAAYSTSGAPYYAYNDGTIDLAWRNSSWLPVMPELPLSPGLVYEGQSALTTINPVTNPAPSNGPAADLAGFKPVGNPGGGGNQGPNGTGSYNTNGTGNIHFTTTRRTFFQHR